MAKSKEPTFEQAMEELEEINRWFQNEDINLDEGLVKLKKGRELIAICRKRLLNVENEFIKIKEEFNEDKPDVNEPFAASETTEEPLESTLNKIDEAFAETEQDFVAELDVVTTTETTTSTKHTAPDPNDDIPF